MSAWIIPTVFVCFSAGFLVGIWWTTLIDREYE